MAWVQRAYSWPPRFRGSDVVVKEEHNAQIGKTNLVGFSGSIALSITQPKREEPAARDALWPSMEGRGWGGDKESWPR